MSLYDFIYNLQRKPARYKKKVLVFLLTVSFIVLAVFWIMIFKNQIRRGTGSYSETETVSGTISGGNMLSPTAALINGFKDLKSELETKFSQTGGTSPGFEDKRIRPVYQLPVE